MKQQIIGHTLIYCNRSVCVEYFVCAETHNYCSFLDTIIVLLAAGKVRMNDDCVYAFNVVHPYYYSSTRLRLLLEW